MISSPELVDATASAGTMPAQRRTIQERLNVPCVYCREAIPASAFAFWSDAKRLLSATCPDCGRRVTLPTATWRRWLIRSEAAASR